MTAERGQLGLIDRQPAEKPTRSINVRSHVTVAEVDDGKGRARRQEDIVLEWFRTRPGRRFTSREPGAGGNPSDF